MKPLSQDAVDFLSTNIEGGRPIPGQSLTNSPEQPQPWEQPAEFARPDEAIFEIFRVVMQPETAGNILLSINNGVGIIDLASIILYTGFLEGKWNPDVMLLTAEPTMFIIMALAEKAGINYVLESGDDEVTEVLPKEQNRRIQHSINYLDTLRNKASEGVSPESVPAEIREKIEEIELPESLLAKTESILNDNSLLARGEE